MTGRRRASRPAGLPGEPAPPPPDGPPAATVAGVEPVAAEKEPGPPTYLLVDGENLDATLGNNVLGGRRPNPEERPRWDRVRSWAAARWDRPVTGLFFLNASGGSLPLPFVQALLALDYRPIPLAGGPGDKVVDVAIQRTLDALVGRPGDVLLASHDRDFLPQLTRLVDEGTRRVGLVAFREFVSSSYGELRDRGLEVFDLEDEVRAFNAPLPRVRIIPLEEFDPLLYL